MSLLSNKICFLIRRNLRQIYLNKVNLKHVSGECTFIRNYATKSKNGKMLKGVFKLGLAGVTVGALMGTGYSIHYMNKPRAHIFNEETCIPAIKEMPEIKPSRSVKLLGDHTGLKLTLFQYQTCPFCCKVRAFLDYYGISYDIVEVDPVLRQAIKWSDYKKVPIVVIQTEDGFQPLNDSTMIISTLASYLKDTKKNISEIVKCFPFINYVDEDGSKKLDIMNKYFLMLSNPKVQPNEKQNIEERNWRKWADNVLVHMLSPNVYRSKDEALQAFFWFSEVGEWEKNFPSWERNLIIYVGASAMWMIGKRLKKKHNLKEDVRQSLYDECNKWVKALKVKGTPFMGGNHPNLADLAVYGVLNSIEGCTAFGDILINTNIKNWYYSMKETVLQHQGAQFT